MKKLLAAAALLLGTTGLAAACPDYGYQGQQSGYATGQDLYLPNSYNTTAGGQYDLYACGFTNAGNFTVAPNFEFRLDGMEAYGRLEIRAQSNCDTVLLINDSNGNWVWNDDTYGLNPAVNFSGPRSGVYDIWVGTFGGAACSATLTMETW